jgi:hypothetical protein
MQRAASRRTALLWQCTRNIRRPCPSWNSITAVPKKEAEYCGAPQPEQHTACTAKLARLIDQVYATPLDADACHARCCYGTFSDPAGRESSLGVPHG